MDHTGHVQVSDKLSEAVFWFFVVQEQCAKIPVPAKEIQYPCKDSADVTSYIEKYLERAKIDNAQVKARAWKATTSNPMP